MLHALNAARSFAGAKVSLVMFRVFWENPPKNLLDILLRLSYLLSLNGGNFHYDSDPVKKSTFKELIKN